MMLPEILTIFLCGVPLGALFGGLGVHFWHARQQARRDKQTWREASAHFAQQATRL